MADNFVTPLFAHFCNVFMLIW